MSDNTITLKFPMGSEVRDVITGFTGIVTGFSCAITGCDQYLVNPPAKADGGEYVSGQWLDDTRLESTGSTKVITLGERTRAGHYGAGPEGPPARR